LKRFGRFVTDATGHYRIVDLRPGIYTVTFEVQGFSGRQNAKGSRLSGNFVATVNADLKLARSRNGHG